MLKFNLQKFAFDPSRFESGATATVAQSYVIEADFEKTSPPAWIEMCLTNYKENPNIQTETFEEICKNGFSTTLLKGYDPEFDFEGLVRKDSPIATMLKNRYTPNLIMDIPFRITNTLLEEQLQTSLTITSFDIGGASSDYLKVSFKGKPFSGEPIIVPLTTENMPDNIIGGEVAPAELTKGA